MNGRLEHDMKREEHINKILSHMPEFMTEWDMNMKACQKSTVTRYQYIMKADLYLRSINQNEKEVTLDDLTFQTAQEFFVSLNTIKKKGKIVESSDSQKCTIWSAMQCMFVYLKKRGYVKENPMEMIDRPINHDVDRIREKRVLLSANDFNKIIQKAELDYNCEMRERNLAMLLLFMTTGMRKTALSEINIDDINEEEGTLTIIDKRKKTHVYYIEGVAQNAIWNWLYKRPNFETAESGDALFINIHGQRVGVTAIDGVVAKYTKKALGKSFTPHKLRAGFINVLYKKTHDLDFVCKAVGHAAVTTTARYMDAKGDERQKSRDLMNDVFNNS